MLSALPWVGGELRDKVPDRLSSLLSVIKTYIDRKRDTSFHGFLRVWSSDEPHPQEEVRRSWIVGLGYSMDI